MIFTSTTTVPLPATSVWNLLLDCSTWRSWWGGPLLRVEPRWGRGGRLCWSAGEPSTIVEFEASTRLTFEGGSGTRSRFTLSEAGAGATLVTLQEDYSASRLQVTSPATVQARCGATLARLEHYARAHVRAEWWEFWKKEYAQAATSSEPGAALIAKDLSHKDRNVRRAAVEQLVESGSPDAADLLVRALTDHDEQVRLTAAQGLSGLGWTPPDAKARAAYLVAAQKWDDLAALGPEGVLPLVSVHLVLGGRYQGDPGQMAFQRLVQMGTTAVAPLIEILRLRKDLPVADEQSWTATCAAEALGSIGDSAAFDVLVEALRSPSEYLRRDAAEALAEIGDERAIPPIAAAAKGARLGTAGPYALAQLGAPQVKEAWLEVLAASANRSGPEALDRSCAARKLGEAGDRTAVPALIHALGDSVASVRCSAVEALGRLGDQSAVQALVRLRQDREDFVRYQVEEALKRLEQALKHTDRASGGSLPLPP